MSVRMEQVLAHVQRMSATERVQLLVEAGLLPESEAQAAIRRLDAVNKVAAKPRARQTGKAAKSRNA